MTDHPPQPPADRPATDPTGSTGPAAPPLLDLARLWVAVRRRRRLWLSFALLGLLAGGLVSVLLPTPPTVVTRILVTHEQDQASDSGTLIRTDATLAMTTRIATAALRSLGSDQPPDQFLTEYTAVGLTNNVLELTVTGSTPDEAARRARALADAFIADHVGRVRAAADAQAKALLDQRDRIAAELTEVNTEIAGAERDQDNNDDNDNDNGDGDGEGGEQPGAAGLDSLYARRAELTDRVSDLSQQAEQAAIGAPRVAAGTQIVDEPRPLPGSPLSSGAAAAALGLVLGLLGGATLAAITGVVKDKPVLRKDIADHLGASVIAQLPLPRRGPARYWRPNRARTEHRRVAATLVRLVRGGTGPVSVLELGSRPTAAALTLDLATELAADRAVTLVEDPAGRLAADDPHGRDLDQLTADRPIRIVGAEDTGRARPGETRIGLGSVTPGTAWTDLSHLGAETLLVVRAGFATTTWLHTVARQLADARIPIIGVVLVDPDPRDGSDGTLWNGLHTALRGRAGHPNTTNGDRNPRDNDTPRDRDNPRGRDNPRDRDNGTGTNGADLPTARFAPLRGTLG